jgi:small subunit ribosomal protein S17
MAEEMAAQGREAAKPRARRRLTKVGVVTSNKMQKTVAVTVKATRAHPTYQRTLSRTQTFLAHDEKGSCAVGDRVLIAETRPLSRRKRWRVVSIVQKTRVAAG